MKRALILFLFFLPSLAQAQQLITLNEAIAARRRIPIYLVDATDGYTPETGVTVTAAECQVSENGADQANCALAACSSNCLVEKGNGLYYYELDSTEVNTVGFITVRISDAAARQAIGWAYVKQLSAGDFAADGQLTSFSGTTAGLASGSVDADNQFNNGWRIDFRGTDRQGTSCITDSTNSGDTVEIADTLSPAPQTGDDYVIYSDATCDPALLTAINAEVVDVLETDTHTELAALPNTTPTMKEMLQYVYEYLRNKVAVTSSAETMYKDDSATSIGTRTLSDNGTTFAKTRMATP